MRAGAAAAAHGEGGGRARSHAPRSRVRSHSLASITRRTSMSSEPSAGWLEEITRRQLLRQAAAGRVALSASRLLAARGGSSNGGGGGGASSSSTGARAPAKLRAGGILRVGATGGGAKDSIDAHNPTTDPDIMRVWNMYESLAVRSPDFSQLQMLLAESIQPDGSKPDSWTVRLKQGIEFHS